MKIYWYVLLILIACTLLSCGSSHYSEDTFLSGEIVTNDARYAERFHGYCRYWGGQVWSQSNQRVGESRPTYTARCIAKSK